MHCGCPKRWREKGAERLFEDLIAENILKLRKGMKLGIQSQWTLNLKTQETHFEIYNQIVERQKESYRHQEKRDLSRDHKLDYNLISQRKPWRPEVGRIIYLKCWKKNYQLRTLCLSKILKNEREIEIFHMNTSWGNVLPLCFP